MKIATVVGLVAAFALGAVVLGAYLSGRPVNSSAVVSASAEETEASIAETDAAANLPAVFRPENTPTPEPTPTVFPTPTAGAPPTPIPGPNWLDNGGFEEGWTTLPPVSGQQRNQEPNGWTLTWVEPGQPLWDAPADLATGIAEMVHKTKDLLPPDEWPGAPQALILDGVTTYKMFHGGAAFGSQLYQQVSLPAGAWRLTVPVQIHMHEDLPPDGSWDEFSVESGVWVLFDGMQAGGWAHAKQMGDHRWFSHVVEFELPAAAEVEVVIRVKSKYQGPKDFFVDATRLQPIAAVSGGPYRQLTAGQALWLARPVERIPADKIVTP
jgi:hypothetical protein